jgi:hypothetical protein
VHACTRHTHALKTRSSLTRMRTHSSHTHTHACPPPKYGNGSHTVSTPVCSNVGQYAPVVDPMDPTTPTQKSRGIHMGSANRNFQLPTGTPCHGSTKHPHTPVADPMDPTISTQKSRRIRQQAFSAGNRHAMPWLHQAPTSCSHTLHRHPHTPLTPTLPHRHQRAMLPHHTQQFRAGKAPSS